jgi:cyclophilin family peptidyl-prolyl cis-trans isomerase
VKPPIALLFSILVLASCSHHQPITPGNVTEVLTEYGRQNPEDEVILETKFGMLRIKLYKDTPLHRANFIKLIKEGHYDKAMFYRVVYEFMIQGGDAANQPKYSIPAEFRPQYFHKKGALAMARRDENNPKMESSAAEFFIIQGSVYDAEEIADEAATLGLTLTPEQRKVYQTEGGYMSLDQKYTVFGEVTEGLDVVDKIAGVKVFDSDKPLEKIPIKISVVEPR